MRAHARRTPSRAARGSCAAKSERLPIAANLADADECARVVAEHAERYGGMDVLVNSAGIGIGGPFGDQPTKAFSLQLDVNLRATLVVTREALPLTQGVEGPDRHTRVDREHDSDSRPRRLRRDEGSAHRAHELVEPRRSGQRSPRNRDLPGLRRDQDDRLDRPPRRKR